MQLTGFTRLKIVYQFMENAVIIPFYKPTLTTTEIISLEQCFKILHRHPIIAVVPHSLDMSFTDGYVFNDVIRFDDSYFKDIYAYNRLMFATDFYKAFLPFEFILIYQLDAFVFEDALDYWCSQEYDYIGAPWLDEDILEQGVVAKTKMLLKRYFYTRFNVMRNGFPSRHQFRNITGNGGFSLRRVAKFYNLTISCKNEMQQYLDYHHPAYNEDRFWSVDVNRKKHNLLIPGYRTALKFAIETCPESAYVLNNHVLPFGCHAWDEYQDFWQPFFKEQGYEI